MTRFTEGDQVRIVLDGVPTPPQIGGVGIVTTTYRDRPWVEVNVRGISGIFEIEKVALGAGGQTGETTTP